MNDEKSFSCQECQQVFKSKTKLATHQRSHVNGNTRMSTRLSLARETNNATSRSSKSEKLLPVAIKQSPKTSAKKRKSQLICPTCVKPFASDKTLKRHQLGCKTKTKEGGKKSISNGKPSPKTSPKPATGADSDAGSDESEASDVEITFGRTDDDTSISDNLKEQIKGKITTRVKSLLKETCGRRPELCTSCDPGEDTAWLKCGKCPKEFKLKASLDRHKKVVHMEGASHSCEVCGTRCADKGTLARHMYIHTGLKPYQCDVCQKQFSRKYHLFRHIHQTGCGGDPPPSYPCQVCGKMFSRNDNLREHLRIHAGDTSRRKKHTCEYCNKEFHCPSMLTVHIRMHTGEKPFKCDMCGKAFPSEGALKKHNRIHTGERPYECKDCGARFSLKGTLNRHQRTHTGIRPHKCSYCGKEFIQVGGLKAHLFHHTGENGFACEHCGKCFNRKARLQMHIRYVHEKVKPYNCSNCGKSFVRKEDLNRHSVLHTGVKAYQCPVCNKTFAIKPSLKLHLLTHNKEEPKSCSECGRAFIRQDCLLRHMRKRHRDMLDKLISTVEKKVLPNINTEMAPNNSLPKQSLSESIKELLSLLVDEATLRAFGWPDKAIDELLEAVIRRCGHTPVNHADYSFMDRLRENCKLLFTVVIDDNAVKTLLNNHTVDEVILHVLRLAKT